jgi:hypothetical protein
MGHTTNVNDVRKALAYSKNSSLIAVARHFTVLAYINLLKPSGNFTYDHI